MFHISTCFNVFHFFVFLFSLSLQPVSATQVAAMSDEDLRSEAQRKQRSTARDEGLQVRLARPLSVLNGSLVSYHIYIYIFLNVFISFSFKPVIHPGVTPSTLETANPDGGGSCPSADLPNLKKKC